MRNRRAGVVGHHVAELVRYRELVVALVARDVRARYRGSALGFLWTLLNPLGLLLVYVLVFGIYLAPHGLPRYAIFALSGLLPWLWISGSLVHGSTSILFSSAMVKSSAFPPQVLPISIVLQNLVNFLLTSFLLPAACLVLDHPLVPGALLWFGPIVLATLIETTAAAVLLSVLTVVFRDVQHLTANLLQFLFFLTPITYSNESVPERFRFLLRANPLASLLRAYQDVLYFGRPPEAGVVAAHFALGLAAWAVAILVFERYRDDLADLV